MTGPIQFEPQEQCGCARCRHVWAEDLADHQAQANPIRNDGALLRRIVSCGFNGDADTQLELDHIVRYLNQRDWTS